VKGGTNAENSDGDWDFQPRVRLPWSRRVGVILKSYRTGSTVMLN
jgi:hypothetical protein